MPDATRAPSAASLDVPDNVIRADTHRLDPILEAALDDWSASPVDQRTEGAVIRATFADPANRLVVLAWLAEVGLIGGAP
jgi:hypothetical protein